MNVKIRKFLHIDSDDTYDLQELEIMPQIYIREFKNMLYIRFNFNLECELVFNTVLLDDDRKLSDYANQNKIKLWCFKYVLNEISELGN